jgi:predicted aspartyl protease
MCGKFTAMACNVEASMRLAAALSVGFLFVPSSGALAQNSNCAPLEKVTSVKLELVDGGDAVLVPVTLNGVPQKLQLATARITSELWPETAAALNLKPEIVAHNGARTPAFVKIDTFKIGQVEISDANLQIGVSLLNLFHPNSDPSDGTLASDVLRNQDFDLDFGNGVLNAFSPDHCPGTVLYWNPTAMDALPITTRDRSTIYIPITLDGQSVEAELDTGNPISLMGLETAKKLFNLVPGSPNLETIPGPLGGMYAHVFDSLSFGTIAIKNVRFKIWNYPLSQVATGMRGSRVILGMNVLKHFHIYIAGKEQKVYLSPAEKAETSSAPKP